MRSVTIDEGGGTSKPEPNDGTSGSEAGDGPLRADESNRPSGGDEDDGQSEHGQSVFLTQRSNGEP